MAIKFSELTPRVTTLADLDLFAVSDSSEGATVSIDFGSLKSIIVDQQTFEDNADKIVTALNNYTSPVTGFNEVQATTMQLQSDSGIVPVDLTYILDYNNHTNTPDIPQDLHDLNNFNPGDNGGYVRFRTVQSGANAGQGELVYQSIQQGTISGGVVISTDFIKEGANLYYTEDRVENFMDTNFGEYYNSFAATFDEGNVKDSYFDTVGEFQFPQVTGSETNVIRIYRTGDIPGSQLTRSQQDRFIAYRAGQNVRIFGANPAERDLLTTTQADFNLQVVGFRDTVQGVEEPHIGISYKIVEWDLETGQTTIGTTGKIKYIGVPEYITDPTEIQDYTTTEMFDAFGVDNFIELDFQALPEGGATGLLIYRRILGGFNGEDQILGADGNHILVAVLGPKELSVGVWQDYFTDDYLTYSNKRSTDNSYTPASTVHFKPRIEPSAAQYGWVDRTISEVRLSNPNSLALSDYVDIYLNDVVSGSPDGCWIAHNDTTKIQTAINFNSVNGRKAIQLNPKNYIITEITVPNEFGINGFAYNTKMTKMPWSGYSNLPSQKMIRASDSAAASNISLVGFDIDGNAVNSYLFDDATSVNRNYAVDYGSQGDSILIDKVRINNVIGGGIYATDCSNFKIFASEVTESGITDRHLYSPLIVDGGENTSITSNRFQNFTSSVDTSVTNKGVIQGNIINACGSGLLTYGSRFLVAEPNILVGPANEFLPNPDAYNSEYDSINVDLTSSAINNFAGYDSDNFKYQENGANYDLSNATLRYKTFAIAQNAEGLETIWISEIENSNNYIAINYNNTTENPLTEGGFGFYMPTQSVERLKFNGGRYTDVLITNAGEDYVNGETIQISGLALGGENLVNDITITVANTDANGAITDIDWEAQPSVIQTTTYTGVTGSASAAGINATFEVRSIGGVYTQEFMADPNNTIPVSPTENVPGNANHVGIAWAAMIDQFVEDGSITNVSSSRGTWGSPYEYPIGSGEFYSDYTVNVTDYKYLVEGRSVAPQTVGVYTHLGFSAGQPYQYNGVEYIPATSGEIIAINDLVSEQEVVIRWKWANYNGTATDGYDGKLTVLNTFVIATGRIK